MLRSGLSPDRYYVAITLAVSSQPLELAAGHVDLSFVEGLEFAAETSFGDDVYVAVTVTNTSDKLVRIEFGACALSLRAYDNPEREGPPVGQSGHGRVCQAYLAFRDLEPGQSLSPNEFTLFVPMRDILPNVRPEERYYFSAVVRVNGASIEVPAGAVVNFEGGPSEEPPEETKLAPIATPVL